MVLGFYTHELCRNAKNHIVISFLSQTLCETVVTLILIFIFHFLPQKSRLNRVSFETNEASQALINQHQSKTSSTTSNSSPINFKRSRLKEGLGLFIDVFFSCHSFSSIFCFLSRKRAGKMSNAYLSFLRRRLPRVSFAKDSLWSWIVAFVTFTFLAINVGIIHSLGIFFETWIGYYETTEATLIWIQVGERAHPISVFLDDYL